MTSRGVPPSCSKHSVLAGRVTAVAADLRLLHSVALGEVDEIKGIEIMQRHATWLLIPHQIRSRTLFDSLHNMLQLSVVEKKITTQLEVDQVFAHCCNQSEFIKVYNSSLDSDGSCCSCSIGRGLRLLEYSPQQEALNTAPSRRRGSCIARADADYAFSSTSRQQEAGTELNLDLDGRRHLRMGPFQRLVERRPSDTVQGHTSLLPLPLLFGGF